MLDYSVSPPTPVSDVFYHLIWTESVLANLDSACALNPDVITEHNYQRLTTTELSKDIGLKPGKIYKVNVIASINSGRD